MGGTPFNGSNELHVSGNVSLAGVLELDIAPFQEFPLHVGENFALIFAGGSFSTDGLTVEAKGFGRRCRQDLPTPRNSRTAFCR